MSSNFQELDVRDTRFGELILRRRRVLSLGGQEVFEVKLNGDFLMSSLVNASEIALAQMALAEVQAETLDVVVGGLGLGYTAAAALDDPRVRSLLVIECLAEVIGWHQHALVPLGQRLSQDQRCRLAQGDFFAWAAGGAEGMDLPSFGAASPPPPWADGRFHAILLDIDHSPAGLLHASHAPFYQSAGLQQLSRRLHPGGVFALWSSEPPDDAFTGRLASVFASCEAHAIEFANPLLDRDDINTVYVARVGQTKE